MKIKILFAVVILASLITTTAGGDVKNFKLSKDESLRRGETRATLNPALFNDPMVRKAYQAAKDIPWVLDSIYCYCMCEESPIFRHKSLLSCYMDNHAAL